MATYDYRIDSNDIDEASRQIDRLSNKELIELAKTLSKDETNQNKNALQHFNERALPILLEFAEMTESILVIDALDECQHIIASFKNVMGFDITESCKALRGLFMMAENIGMSIENNELVLALIFDYLTFS